MDSSSLSQSKINSGILRENGKTKFFDTSDIEKYAQKVAQLINNYHDNYRNVDVFPKEFTPGMLQKHIPTSPPKDESTFDSIIETTEKLILPNILKWQHPRFHGYFQSITSTPVLFAEMIRGAVNPVCFQWNSSPVSTELECIVVDWIAQMIQLPEKFLLSKEGGGCIINSVGEALFLFVQYAKYRKMKELGIKFNDPKVFNLVAYHAEYSFFVYKKHFHLKEINHVRKIPSIYCQNTKTIKLDLDYLREQVKKDIEAGLIPFFFGGTIGSTCANIDDPSVEVSKICKENGILYAVDLAYSSGYMVVPEIRARYSLEGINCFAVNFSKAGLCAMGSALYYIDDKKEFIEAITGEKVDKLIDYPQYLKNRFSDIEGVVDYNNWQVGFGRRFDSLRLYWVIQRFGIKGQQDYINYIMKLSDYALEKTKSYKYLDLFCQKNYSLVCLRIRKYPNGDDFESLEKQNQFIIDFVEEVNKDGFMLLSKSVNNNMHFIRFSVGNYDTTEHDIDDCFANMERIYLKMS